MNLHQIKCWITRHHWLLIYEEALPGTSMGRLHYSCQICDKQETQIVEYL